MGRNNWSPEEDEILKDACKKHGEKDWKRISECSGLDRCPKSCRQRWVEHLRPGLNKKGEKFSESEERKIVELIHVHGTSWKTIAANLPGRGSLDVKNHWNNKLRKKWPILDIALRILHHMFGKRNEDHSMLISYIMQVINTSTTTTGATPNLPNGFRSSPMFSSTSGSSTSGGVGTLFQNGSFHDQYAEAILNYLPYAASGCEIGGFNTSNSTIGNASSSDAGTDSTLHSASVYSTYVENEASSNTSFSDANAYVIQNFGIPESTFNSELLHSSSNNSIYNDGMVLPSSFVGTGSGVVENETRSIPGFHGQISTYNPGNQHDYSQEISNWPYPSYAGRDNLSNENGIGYEGLQNMSSVDPTMSINNGSTDMTETWTSNIYNYNEFQNVSYPQNNWGPL